MVSNFCDLYLNLDNKNFCDKIFVNEAIFVSLLFAKGKIVAAKICEGANGSNTINTLY